VFLLAQDSDVLLLFTAAAESAINGQVQIACRNNRLMSKLPAAVLLRQCSWLQ
jgi:hypothetical protein